MTNPETDRLHDRDYLGDGVHVGHDGWHVVVWLEAPSAFGLNAVALEPGVMKRLTDYGARLRRALTGEEADDGT